MFTAAIGLAPVEAIRIESDIEERRREKSTDGSDVLPHVRSVCNIYPPRMNRADESSSVGALRIESRSERIGEGKIIK